MTQLQIWALAGFAAIVALAFVMIPRARKLGGRKHRRGADASAGLPYVTPVILPGDSDDGSADHSGDSGGGDAGGADGGGG